MGGRASLWRKMMNLDLNRISSDQLLFIPFSLFKSLFAFIPFLFFLFPSLPLLGKKKKNNSPKSFDRAKQSRVKKAGNRETQSEKAKWSSHIHVTLLKNLFLHRKIISYILANTELSNGIHQEPRKRRQIPM